MLARSSARVGKQAASKGASNTGSFYTSGVTHSMLSQKSGAMFGKHAPIGLSFSSVNNMPRHVPGQSDPTVGLGPRHVPMAGMGMGQKRAFTASAGVRAIKLHEQYQAQDLADGFSTAHAELFEIGYTNPAGALRHPNPEIRNEAMRRLSVKPTFARKPELLFRKNASTHTLLEDVQRGIAQLEAENAASTDMEGELHDMMTANAGNLMKTSGASMGAATMGSSGDLLMAKTFSGGVSDYISFLDNSVETMSYAEKDAATGERKVSEFARTASMKLYDNAAADVVVSEPEYQSIMNAQLMKTLALKAGTPEHEAHTTGVAKSNPNLFMRKMSGALLGSVSEANNPVTASMEKEQTRRMALGLSNTIEKADGDGFMGSAAGFLLFGYLGVFCITDLHTWTSSLAGADRTPEEFVRR